MPATKDIAGLFSSIAGRYDFLNHFLSLNIDKLWRRKLIRLYNCPDHAKVLDLCCGTGDIAIAFAKKNKTSQCFGVDFSDKMLEIAQSKIEKAQLEQRISLKQADALEIPFEDDFFDVVFMGFGLRNLTDITQAMQEIKRVLKTGGKVFILEFSPRQNALIQPIYKIYLRFILPVIGSIISGDRKAYRYLSTSIPAFLEPEKVMQVMFDQDWSNVKDTALTNGIAYIYEGTK